MRDTRALSAGLRTHRRAATGGVLLDAASQATGPSASGARGRSRHRSFLITAAGQFRIHTGFPLSARPRGHANRRGQDTGGTFRESRRGRSKRRPYMPMHWVLVETPENLL